MNQPVIVLSPQNIPMEAPFAGQYNYSSTFHTDSICLAGGIPVIPPYLCPESAETLLSRADGLVLTGGADVDPSLYGEERIPECGCVQPLRDKNDRILLETALKLRKPVLCICRGAQIANVYFGGTLWQDLPSQRPESLPHCVESDPGYRSSVHTVRIVEHTPLSLLFGTDRIGVNSLHHQAVKKLADRLKPMAYASDGIVESWYLTDPQQWIRGYQWHPEMMVDSVHRRIIFEDFLSACRNE